MNNSDKKKITIFIVIVFWLIATPYLYRWMKARIEATPDTSITIDTGSIKQPNIPGSGSVSIISGATINKPKTDMEEYEAMKKIVYNPGIQPTKLTPGMSYADRSQLLIDYLSSNTLSFKSPSIKAGYLYVKIAGNTSNPFFIYWNNTQKSGILYTKEAVYSSGDGYLFKLNNIPVVDYFTHKRIPPYDFMADINSHPQSYVGGFMETFDGTYIQEIVVAWK